VKPRRALLPWRLGIGRGLIVAGLSRKGAANVTEVNPLSEWDFIFCHLNQLRGTLPQSE
jgi:hypothetical protein